MLLSQAPINDVRDVCVTVTSPYLAFLIGAGGQMVSPACIANILPVELSPQSWFSLKSTISVRNVVIMCEKSVDKTLLSWL